MAAVWGLFILAGERASARRRAMTERERESMDVVGVYEREGLRREEEIGEKQTQE